MSLNFDKIRSSIITLMNIFTDDIDLYIHTVSGFVANFLPAFISPVSIAFVVYVYFINRRIKKSLKDEEFKNSKKGAFLDSFRAGLIVESILSLTKIRAGITYFTIAMVLWISGGKGWSLIRPIWILFISYGFQMVVKYFVMKLILRKNGHKLKFKEVFSGLLMSTLVGIAILIIEYLILGFLLINIKK